MMKRFPTTHLPFAVTVLAVAAAFFSCCGASSAQTEDTPEDAVAIFDQAQDLHERGDLAGAIKLYDKAIKAVPEFPEAEYQRGVAELALGQPAEAERSFRRALELREDWPPALTGLGSLLVHSGRYAEADTLLSKALETDPQNSSALAALVELRLRTKTSPAVLQQLLDKVAALTAKANPTAAAWTARAALESALDKQDAARSSVANALKIDQKDRAALLLSGDLALRNGDGARAKEIAAQLEKLGANTNSLILLKANIAAADGDIAAASKLLAQLPLEWSEADALRSRIASSRTSPAELEKQLETDPKNAAALGRLCVLLRRDEPQKAVEYCRRASEAEPASIVPVIGYGAALVQAKQFEPAAAVLKKVIDAAPDNATAHANLATALFELKRYDEARGQYEWLTTAQPGLAAAYYFLAVCYDRLGKNLDAMANYQQYLQLADADANKLDIEKVNLRLAQLQKKKK